MTTFEGFPVAALDFYDDLEIDNTKLFWEAHKTLYEDGVKKPMLALTAALEQEFGTAKVFCPYRDVRFALAPQAAASDSLTRRLTAVTSLAILVVGSFVPFREYHRPQRLEPRVAVASGGSTGTPRS